MSNNWVPLKKGDPIYIVAPASKTINPWDDLKQGCHLIREAGFRPVYDANIFAENAYLQAACGFSNSDELRYLSFVNAINSEAKVIWCFRGGYGSDRVAAQLAHNNIRPSSVKHKLLVGFSDITVLFHFCGEAWGWPLLHAPVLKQVAQNNVTSDSIDHLWRCLRGEQSSFTFVLQAMNEEAAHIEKKGLTAKLVGGNMTVIHAGMGTPWEMPRDGIILFEEVNEAPYRVARILEQWRVSGWLEDAKAIIFADFICNEEDSVGMREVLEDFATSVFFPVLRCPNVGHGKSNIALPMGVKAKLKLGNEPVLEVGF